MASGRVAPTQRGQQRREQILNAAAELFATNGFHAVGVSDIGAAAGVTGAALYRHFANKTDVLVSLFERFIDALLDIADAATRVEEQADVVLGLLIAAHVELAMRDRAVLAVYSQEVHNLPVADRRRLRRKQRHYVEIWRSMIQQLDASLPDGEALIRVEAAFGLLNSVPNLSRSVADRIVLRVLCRMAAAALEVPVAADTCDDRPAV